MEPAVRSDPPAATPRAASGGKALEGKFRTPPDEPPTMAMGREGFSRPAWNHCRQATESAWGEGSRPSGGCREPRSHTGFSEKVGRIPFSDDSRTPSLVREPLAKLL